MNTIPAPTLVLPREEWTDADFDLPDGVPLHSPDDRDDDDQDWDLQFDVLPHPPASPFVSTPSLPFPQDDDDDDGVSTIKAAALDDDNSATIKTSTPAPTAPSTSFDDDFEDAFALPEDLTQLSLAPISLNHRSSKNSIESWDKDHTSSSQSSDAYSTLGFADTSPSSNTTSAASSIFMPESEAEPDDDDDDLDGLVLPTGSSKEGPTQSRHSKAASPDPESDFEMGLVIEDDVDLSPSRLLTNSHNNYPRLFSRSNSIPPARPSSLRPPSRLKSDRAKSPTNPPPSSTRQLQKIRLSPSPPLPPPSRSQTLQSYQPFSSAASPSPSPSASSTFLAPKPGSLRGQKSHTGLKPASPPASARNLTRKASLSSLIESGQASSSTSSGIPRPARYEEPTAASRAKSHKSSTSRLQDFKVPPTRPSTPSSNPAALRLTMPTQSRLKSRPALSQVFGSSASGPAAPASASLMRSTSPLPPRPPSSLSLRAAARTTAAAPPPSLAPKILRKPKRQRMYGDGTELDAIEDLPADREKEAKFRVQPKGYGNRIPGATYASKVAEKPAEKGTVRKKGKRDGSIVNETAPALTPSTNTLRRVATRIEFPSKPVSPPEPLPKKKKKDVSSPATRRKPTLIRNLGGSSAPRVVGDMKWNPQTLRWEGNDQVLRDFDAAVGTSTRPALITHLTGSSIGSPIGSFASGARIVGNMIFDPARMCWISTLPPDEDEPDVFANLADDEEDGDPWETKSGTIRANQHCVSDAGSSNTSCANSNSSSNVCMEAPSPARSRTRTISESGSDRGSRASMVVGDVDDEFIAACRLAEERHRVEMKGWKSSLSKHDVFSGPDRSCLYEIRALATRKY
ncbi:hypothetical protein BDQ17DRAFT_1418566 [Cyathus striatus]|nr:hypothetical protein BDQ17DRAFT_1418566 [Cyathus striatus]